MYVLKIMLKRISAAAFIAVGLFAMSTMSCRTFSRSLEPRDFLDDEIALPGEAIRHYGNAPAYEQYVQAELLTENGDHQEATRRLAEALADDPVDIYLRTRLALSLIRLHQMDKAKKQIDRALREDPANEYAWLVLAEYYWTLDLKEKAEEAARKAIQVEPDSVYAALWLAGKYRTYGDSRQALELLRRAAQIDPENADVMLALGEMSLNLGDPFDAERYFKHFVELRPYQVEAIAQLALTYLKTGNRQDSIDLLVIAVEKSPSNVALRLKLVELLIESGLMQRAFQEIRSLPPSQPGDIRDVLGRACLLAKADRIYEARNWVNAYLGAFPQETAGRLVLAELEIALGRREQAEILLQSHVEGSMTPSEIQYQKRLMEELRSDRVPSPSCELWNAMP